MSGRVESRRGDHPRMRGEHSLTCVSMVSIGGSSPHARGALKHFTGRDPAFGIIPACAGSTRTPRSPPPEWTDHPRMRGEHVAERRAGMIAAGSSPHARGARRRNRTRRSRLRIIPACAGSTGQTFPGALDHRDHPRMRGEHAVDGSAGLRLTGSSPHARGALRRVEDNQPKRRIIPACAGSTVRFPRKSDKKQSQITSFPLLRT